MPQIQSIRSRRRNGESIASIACSERVSEPTVRKYLRVDDLSARPPVRRRRGSVIDEWLPMIVFCQVGVGRFGVSFSPCERRVSGRFGVGRSCWLLVIALVIA